MQAHDSIGHKRKYTDEPYYVHPGRVAKLVASVTSDAEIIAAAWLHDVLEDVSPKNPNFSAEVIRKNFGDRVLLLVLDVTDVSTLADGNRAKRKTIDRAHLANASDDAKTIKLADLIDNIVDITENDPNFAKIFRKEVVLDLPYLQSGNEQLYERLRQLLLEESL
jgi:(p)ppGpp synthase/HD superfamily hydrolase